MKFIKFTYILLLLTFLAITAEAGTTKLPSNFPIDFDSRALASAETTSWRAYYEKDFSLLFKSIVEMLHEQFHLSPLDSFLLGSNAAEAAKTFSNLPRRTTKQQYEDKVMPALKLFYSQLKTIYDGNWDPTEVAQAELNWWVARRTPGENAPEQVGVGIAKVYELLYGENNEYIQKAGLLRAEAAHIRDVESRRGRIHWQKIEDLLTQSYQSLLEGIALNNASTKKQNIAK